LAVVLATNLSLLPARASEIIRVVVGYCNPIFLMVPKPKLAFFNGSQTKTGNGWRQRRSMQGSNGDD
jgi:hypothetical protein